MVAQPFKLGFIGSEGFNPRLPSLLLAYSRRAVLSQLSAILHLQPHSPHCSVSHLLTEQCANHLQECQTPLIYKE